MLSHPLVPQWDTEKCAGRLMHAISKVSDETTKQSPYMNWDRPEKPTQVTTFPTTADLSRERPSTWTSSETSAPKRQRSLSRDKSEGGKGAQGRNVSRGHSVQRVYSPPPEATRKPSPVSKADFTGKSS